MIILGICIPSNSLIVLIDSRALAFTDSENIRLPLKYRATRRMFSRFPFWRSRAGYRPKESISGMSVPTETTANRANFVFSRCFINTPEIFNRAAIRPVGGIFRTDWDLRDFTP